jgi:hypothetical protein
MASEPQVNPAHLTPIPPAIRRQAEQAERLQRESLGLPEVDPGATAPQTPPQAPPAANPPPQAPPAPQTPQTPPGDADERVRTAEGRLAVEREKRQNLEGQISSLQRMVSELQQASRAPAPVASTQQSNNRRVTPEQEADYGDDLNKYIDARAEDIADAKTAALKDEIASLKGQLGQVGTRVAARDTEDLFSELHRRVPGWVEQNSDENFINWLQQAEPFSRMKRHDLLTRAFDSNDVERVILFFQGYRAEAAATGNASTPPAPATTVPGANGRVPLETFAAPGRAAPAQASAPPGQKPVYTRAGIAQFYTDKAAGRWRGREAQAADIEADIFRAGPEGRVNG